MRLIFVCFCFVCLLLIYIVFCVLWSAQPGDFIFEWGCCSVQECTAAGRDCRPRVGAVPYTLCEQQ